MKNNETENEFYLPFHKKTYWEEYYKNCNLNNLSEWYFDLHSYNSNLFDINKWDTNAEIIIIGVGNSKIIDYLISKKFAHVTLVDFSSILIDNFKKKYETLEECKEWDFVCEDVIKLTKEELIPENFYDIVIDKGCIDCILSDPDKRVDQNLSDALNEIKKIMTENAYFYNFSTVRPDKNVPIITASFNSKIHIEEISKKHRNLFSDLNQNLEQFYREFIEDDNIYYLYKIKKV